MSANIKGKKRKAAFEQFMATIELVAKEKIRKTMNKSNTVKTPVFGDTRRVVRDAGYCYSTRYYCVAEQIFTPYKDKKKAGNGFWKFNGYVSGCPGHGYKHSLAVKYCNQ